MARGRRTPHIATSVAHDPEAQFVQGLIAWRDAELAQPSNAYRDERERHFAARIRQRIAARMQDLIMWGDETAIRNLARGAALNGDPDAADITSAIRLHRAWLDRGDPLPDDYPDSVLRVTPDDLLRAGWQRHGGAQVDARLIDHLRADPLHAAASVDDWARAADALLQRETGCPLLPIPTTARLQWNDRYGTHCDPQQYLGVIRDGRDMEIWHLHTLHGQVDGVPRAIAAGSCLMKISTPDDDPTSQLRWLDADVASLPLVSIDPRMHAVDVTPAPSPSDLHAVIGACPHPDATWTVDDTGDRVLGCATCGACYLDVIPAAALDARPADIDRALAHERFHRILQGEAPPETWAQARERYADDGAHSPATDLITTLFAAD